MFSYPDKTQHIFFRWELGSNGRWTPAYYYDEKPTKLYGADIPHTDWVDIPMVLPYVYTDRLMIDDEVVQEVWISPFFKPVSPPDSFMSKEVVPRRQLTPEEIDTWIQHFKQVTKAIEELNRTLAELFPELKELDRG